MDFVSILKKTEWRIFLFMFKKLFFFYSAVTLKLLCHVRIFA